MHLHSLILPDNRFRHSHGSHLPPQRFTKSSVSGTTSTSVGIVTLPLVHSFKMILLSLLCYSLLLYKSRIEENPAFVNLLLAFIFSILAVVLFRVETDNFIRILHPPAPEKYKFSFPLRHGIPPGCCVLISVMIVLHRYRPIPVDFWCSLPLYPVNPRSKNTRKIFRGDSNSSILHHQFRAFFI